ncbi:mobile mystery protein A [Pontivivens nitratireducens]|uniref:Mobile mystery protein A n=1 Tax=Pontivivens nitratireducens TaxID=2758038 RepID=A0A6G7VPS3_9RHOB|nr:mobile mystery protein A [Pontibrevibacter nitratireducens]QIK42083.1 mobile mystery protein A [Pontibrevibacter nitratireducens]
MGVKDTARRQYIRVLDSAAQQLPMLQHPREGWISTMRKALGMSAPDLARRMGVTKPAIYQVERKELDGGVTLQHMEKLAQAMGARFVYAIVPETCIEDVVEDQARQKAEAIVRRASAHMALEKQSLLPEQTESEIERLTQELMREQPSDFWEGP